MTATKEEIRNLRLQLTHQMHNYIMNTGDENIYAVWMTEGIPDCPSEEDFEYYANDPFEFRELCELFGQLVCKDELENY